MKLEIHAATVLKSAKSKFVDGSWQPQTVIQVIMIL